MSPPKTTQPPLADTLLGEFCDLLSTRTGLQVREKDRSMVSHTLLARCDVLRLSPDRYLHKLRIDQVDGPEWTLLMPQLTNGESYFERDKGQFALIRNTILPDLIERKRARNEHSLRLWSAGCSTGEEVYSLAMATEAVLPPGWKATVLGTDINAFALQKARRGVYG
ncbi:MAG: chemotaxis protein CheR, partial [Sphingobacteriales bacterium]